MAEVTSSVTSQVMRPPGRTPYKEAPPFDATGRTPRRPELLILRMLPANDLTAAEQPTGPPRAPI